MKKRVKPFAFTGDLFVDNVDDRFSFNVNALTAAERLVPAVVMDVVDERDLMPAVVERCDFVAVLNGVESLAGFIAVPPVAGDDDRRPE